MKYLISVEESIKDILLTPLGTRLMRPDYGSHLHELLDRRVDDAWRAQAAQYVVQAVHKYEPRAKIERVSVLQEGEKVWLKIYLKSGEEIDYQAK